ncbi:YczE/YyaS/YitT family protein [Pontibacter mangrovi]|uniref:YitT family protein n=1 Tax=Pontibacter mangrovi TaxID=2589816 RepID=A0A501W4C6_9BACT|nr:hypothetical protein [Pontibacter mangrovi]TPE44439.1 hypothetical protein FJM65_09860 [Pontibacter mangrovi]
MALSIKSDTPRNWVIRYTFFFLGLILFGLGIAIAVKVRHLGLHPWDVLNVALSDKFGWSIGTWSVIVGMVVIFSSLLVSRKYINIGTFLNALLIGPFMDFFLWLDFLPDATHTWLDYLWLLLAILIIGMAGGLYVAGGIGAGPRDGFMLTMADRTGLSVSKSRIVVESTVLVIGFLLGGPIHVVTFLYTLILSPVFQVALNVFAKLRDTLTEERPEEVNV